MATPAIIPFMSDLATKTLGYEISDHNLISFNLDFENVEKGPGLFRAHPSLLKNSNYKKSMIFNIRKTILEGIKGH